MDTGAVTPELARILAASFDVPETDIKPDSTFEELGVDSVAAVELADIIKEKFGVTLTDEELTVNTTYDTLVGTITRKAS